MQSKQHLVAVIRSMMPTIFVTGLLGLPVASSATEGLAAKPSGSNTADVSEGRSAFRTNCAPCHGVAAHGGGRGPDLTSGNWTHGGSDAEIFRSITHGVPGTEMPANDLDDSEVLSIIAYLRSLAPPSHQVVSGDPARGKQIFTGSGGCASCHMVDGSGGRLGPDLSRVGAARAVAYLVESIREPDKELTNGAPDPNNHYGVPLPYDTVTVVTMSGERIVGVARNEDTYSVQLIGTDQTVRCFLKREVREVIHEHKSLMPAYPESTLGPTQLQDVVAYLVTLGRDSRAVTVAKP